MSVADRAGTSGRRVPDWLLPGELTAGAPPVGGRPGRTARDWVVDAVLFGLAAAFWLQEWAGFPPYYSEAIPGWMLAVDPWVGAAACLALWWRRSYPLALAITMVPALWLSGTAFGAVLVAVLTVAVHRGWVAATSVTAVLLGTAALFAYENPPPGTTSIAAVILLGLMYLVPLSWGMTVRFRRQLILSLRRDAERERREHRLRLAQARRAERERIAREMHDVLAHRISLISVHAGALAYRTAQAEAGPGRPLDAAEVGAAIEVISGNARQALVELADVLAVLRADGDVCGTERPGDGVPGGGSVGDEAQGVDGRHNGGRHHGGRHNGGRRNDGRADPAPPDPARPDTAQSGAARPDDAAPQPCLRDLDRLVAEARAAGQDVILEVNCPPNLADTLRPATQRTVYRVVQEGLTNARKHAPGAPVAVRVAAAPETGVVATVTNPLLAGVPRFEVPGAGVGLVGLAERAAVDGGVVEHGPVDGGYRLTARLPWPS
jgi:signal transduction histidine kinase